MSTTSLPVRSAAESPRHIIEMVMNYRSSKVMLVAVYYDLFTLISSGLNTAAQISDRLKTDERATQILLEALESLQFLSRDGICYWNTPLSETYLVRDNPQYMGHNLKYQEMIWEAWSDLRDVLKRGRPKQILGDWLMNEEFSRDYIRGMADIAARPSREIAALLSSTPVQKILDVGAGPGAYSLALLEAFPDAEATLLDLPSTVRVTKSLLEPHPHRSRVQFEEGNYHIHPFGSAQYDVVIMSHITHDEGELENINLIRKAFKALKPGGKIVIHDFMTEENKTTTPFLGLFSVHMLVYTQSGKVYSAQEYQKWLEEVGFDKLEVHDIAKELPNSSKALIGKR